ncbi:MAG: hypothetical protein NDI90_20490 [Nitrospira sp. BO4]|jgi:hypothetical protein|nr:hypothetical protein [Nitrospira sp. BO4]
MFVLLKSYFKTLPALLLLLTLGCVTSIPPVTPEQIARADYGKVPARTIYQEAVKDYMQGVLFDPYTAYYRFFGEPQKGYVRISGTKNPSPVFGYLVQVGIDAKNLKGSYVGEHPYRFLIKNETLYLLNSSDNAEVVP